MSREIVKQSIKELALNNYNLYEVDYQTTEDASGQTICTEECTINILGLAEAFYTTRTEEEVERDENLGLNLDNYAEFCSEAFRDFLQAKSNS